MSNVTVYRNFTCELETLRWWLFMRTTWTGPSTLVRGLWKFAMTWVRDVHEMGLHVVEDDKDEWVIAPLVRS